MFQLGRELRRIFRVDPAFSAPRDGLAGRDPAVLELLDVEMLRAEAKAADVAAGRIGVKDRPSMQLLQATVWRELARRTGDVVCLRKAASAAELACNALDRRQRPELWAGARVLQAQCVLLGTELFGDEGLAAAADQALAEAVAAAPKSPAGAFSKVLRARIGAQAALLRGENAAALALASECESQIVSIGAGRRDRTGLGQAASARLVRAELLAACGVQAKDERVLEDALRDAVAAAASLDPAYVPVTWSRAVILRGEILTHIGETTGDAGALSRAVEVLSSVFDNLLRDHSPMDWATAHIRLGQALAALGQATAEAQPFDQARRAFDRALVVLQREPAPCLRAAAAQGRAAAVAAQAECLGDLMVLDEAEAAFRCELAGADPKADPVGWAVIQVSLAQIYQSRLVLMGRDRGERARAALALDAALEVFSEHGLRSLSVVAQNGLERLRAKV